MLGLFRDLSTRTRTCARLGIFVAEVGVGGDRRVGAGHRYGVVGVVSFEHDERELELATLGLFAELGWATANASGETFPDGMFGREHPGEVVLRPRLEAAVERLNPDVTESARWMRSSSWCGCVRPGPEVRNNRDVWNLLRDGAKVEVRATTGPSGR